jgi:hypothetical protein
MDIDLLSDLDFSDEKSIVTDVSDKGTDNIINNILY